MKTFISVGPPLEFLNNSSFHNEFFFKYFQGLHFESETISTNKVVVDRSVLVSEIESKKQDDILRQGLIIFLAQTDITKFHFSNDVSQFNQFRENIFK